VDYLITSARAGNTYAIPKLMYTYNSIIESTIYRVYTTFGKTIPVVDISDRARQIFRAFVLGEYELDGRAKFKYFLSKMLYAKLIHEFRPLHRKKKVLVPLEYHSLELSVPPKVWQRERANIIYKLLKFAEKTFTRQENAFIDRCILGGESQADLAREYRISRARASQIYGQAIEKLREKLRSIGIKKGDL